MAEAMFNISMEGAALTASMRREPVNAIVEKHDGERARGRRSA
jgi:hypothetical protein